MIQLSVWYHSLHKMYCVSATSGNRHTQYTDTESYQLYHGGSFSQKHLSFATKSIAIKLMSSHLLLIKNHALTTQDVHRTLKLLQKQWQTIHSHMHVPHCSWTSRRSIDGQSVQTVHALYHNFSVLSTLTYIHFYFTFSYSFIKRNSWNSEPVSTAIV